MVKRDHTIILKNTRGAWDMMCEMCGKDAELFKTNIEGIMMDVCERCSKYGKVIKKAENQVVIEKKLKKAMPIVKKVETETVFVIVPDFARRIKDAREKLGLKQDELAKSINERESSIHKYETGQVEPSMSAARKLEKFLSVRLVEEHTEAAPSGPSLKGSDEVTLGDMIKIRKRS